MATRLSAAVVLVSLVSLVVAAAVGITTGRRLGQDISDARLNTLDSNGAANVASRLRSIARITDVLAVSPATLDALGGGVVAPIAGFEAAADRFDLDDIFLIDVDGSTIVSTATGGPAVGASLNSDEFSGSTLAIAVNDVVADPSHATVTSDLGFETPTSTTLLGVVASPVFDRGELVGVVASSYDGRELAGILLADRAAVDPSAVDPSAVDPSASDVPSGSTPAAAGATPPDTSARDAGDLYLIGGDGTTRSDPLAYLLDPTGFLDVVEANGKLTAADRAVVDVHESTVLTLRAPDPAVVAARSGTTGVEHHGSVDGVDIVSSVTRVDNDDLDWYVVTEVPVAAAETDLDAFRNVLVVGASIFILLLTFAAVAWASRLLAPIRAISERLGIGAGDTVEVADAAEVLASSGSVRTPVEFEELALSFEMMTATLREQHALVATARAERLALLRNMLPASVAQRIVAGDLQTLDEVERASVVVVVVTGLGELVRLGSGHSDRQLIDRLHTELDDLADSHGLDRIKVVGDAYFAACGHDRPYIDHAPRVMKFAAAARDAIRELGGSVGLDSATGVQTGAVTVGMTGGKGLIYDVWGPTVTTAHGLARRARRGQILMTQEVRVLLPDSMVTPELDSEVVT